LSLKHYFAAAIAADATIFLVPTRKIAKKWQAVTYSRYTNNPSGRACGTSLREGPVFLSFGNKTGLVLGNDSAYRLIAISGTM